MTVLDDAFVKATMEAISRELEACIAAGYEGNADKVKDAIEVYTAQLKQPGFKVNGGGLIVAYELSKTGRLTFKTTDGLIMIGRTVPRIKSRRLLRRWAKKQLGKVWMDITVQPLMPIETIHIDIKIPNESTHPLLRTEGHAAV